MGWMFRLRLMPLLVVVAALSFGVRFGDFVSGVSTQPGQANAQTAQMNEELEVAQASTDGEPRTAPVGGASSELDDPPTNWRDAADEDLEFSSVRMELFEDLKKRRKDLDDREQELSVREALLKAAEKELDQKYKELVSLRSEIQDLLQEQTEEEKMRIESLVKIYEGMKPKDAARIFNTLDLDVLLNVVGRMSERKSAPIIASMEPERARTLTIMLMEQKALPDLDAMPNPVNGFNS
ncbi:MAG: MotE family protein [Pseudomonadota bacterium]